MASETFGAAVEGIDGHRTTKDSTHFGPFSHLAFGRPTAKRTSPAKNGPTVRSPSPVMDQTMPCAIIASATFRNPATLAPNT